ncbi:MAG: hypothetical protein ACP5KL_03870 [Thermoplasmata archaeon]
MDSILKEYDEFLKGYRVRDLLDRIEDWKNEIKHSPAFDKFYKNVDPSRFWAQPYKPKMLPYGNLQKSIVKKTLVSFFTSDSPVIYYGPFGSGKTVLGEASANVYYRLLSEYADIPDFSRYYMVYQMNNASTKSQIWRGDMPAGEKGMLTIKSFPMFLMHAYVMGNVVSLDEFTQAPEEIQGWLNSIVEVGSEIDTPFGRIPVSPVKRVVIIFNPAVTSNTARDLAYSIENRAGRKIPVEMSPREDVVEILRNVLPEVPDFLRRYVASLVAEAREKGSRSSIRTALSLAKQLNIEFSDNKNFDRIHEDLINMLNLDPKAFVYRVSGRLLLKESDVMAILKHADYRSFISLLNQYGLKDFLETVREVMQEQDWSGQNFFDLLP